MKSDHFRNALLRRLPPFVLLAFSALASPLLVTSVALADGSYPGDEPVPVPGDWPEGTAVKLFDPSLNDLTLECKPKLPDPIGPVVELVVGHWESRAVDSVAGYDLTNCRFIEPRNLCDVLGPDPQPWQPLVGDWDGDGVDSLAFYDSEACSLRDPRELGETELAQPDADAWRFLAGDWEGSGVDSLAVARPHNIGDDAGGLLLAGNFGHGETFGVFDPETGFTELLPENLEALESAPTKLDFPLWACFDYEIECWSLYIPGAPEIIHLCQRRKCCLGSPCYDYLTRK